jgi:hypothetical protein
LITHARAAVTGTSHPGTAVTITWSAHARSVRTALATHTRGVRTARASHTSPAIGSSHTGGKISGFWLAAIRPSHPRIAVGAAHAGTAVRASHPSTPVGTAHARTAIRATHARAAIGPSHTGNSIGAAHAGAAIGLSHTGTAISMTTHSGSAMDWINDSQAGRKRTFYIRASCTVRMPDQCEGAIAVGLDCRFYGS